MTLLGVRWRVRLSLLRVRLSLLRVRLSLLRVRLSLQRVHFALRRGCFEAREVECLWALTGVRLVGIHHHEKMQRHKLFVSLHFVISRVQKQKPAMHLMIFMTIGTGHVMQTNGYYWMVA